MGGAGLALCGGPEAAFYNAAALGRVQTYSLTSTYVAHFAGVDYGTIGISAPCFGLQVLVLDSGSIVNQGQLLRYSTQGIVASTGVQFVPETVFVGLRARLLRISSPVQAFGWAIDPCLLITVGNVHGGLMLEGGMSRDVTGSGIEGESWGSGVSVGVGFGGQLTSLLRCRAGVEVADSFSTERSLRAGLELQIGRLMGRVGYGGVGLTAGLSVVVDCIRLYFGYAGRRDLGGSYRIGVALDLDKLLHGEPAT